MLLGDATIDETLEGVEVVNRPSLDGVPPSDGWTVAVVPHERWVAAGGFGGPTPLVKALGGLGGEVKTVYVPRVEPSVTGTRIRMVVRAWCGEAVHSGLLADLDFAPTGPTVIAQGIEIVASRWEWSDAQGLAETAAREGDLLGAAARWGGLADAREGMHQAWCHTRSAALYQLECPTSQEAWRRLFLAIEASPRLPEALLRLAELAIARNSIDDGLVWGKLATQLAPAHGLAHLVGTGTWLVPGRLAVALHRRGDPRAGTLASASLSAGAPGALADTLRLISETTGSEPCHKGRGPHPGGGGTDHA